ncbi:unnamed protein product [Amoebophrya sp. A120]|nr:unnamed protein product [Amoebophrya sp. A120]|eukprot:GSA120T00009913001.1
MMCETEYDIVNTNSDFRHCCAQMCTALTCDNVAPAVYHKRLNEAQIQCTDWECDRPTDQDRCCVKGCREPSAFAKIPYNIQWHSVIISEELYPHGAGVSVWQTEANYTCKFNYESLVSLNGYQASLKCEDPDTELQVKGCNPICRCTADQMTTPADQELQIGTPVRSDELIAGQLRCPRPAGIVHESQRKQYCTSCNDKHKLKPLDSNGEVRCWADCSSFTSGNPPQDNTDSCEDQSTAHNSVGAYYLTNQANPDRFCSEQKYRWQNCLDSCCVLGCYPPVNQETPGTTGYGYTFKSGVSWLHALTSATRGYPQTGAANPVYHSWDTYFLCEPTHHGTAQYRCLGPELEVEMNGCREKCDSPNGRYLCATAGQDYEVKTNAATTPTAYVCDTNTCHANSGFLTSPDFKTCCAQRCTALTCPFGYLKRSNHASTQCADYQCTEATDLDTCCVRACTKPAVMHEEKQFVVTPDWNAVLTDAALYPTVPANVGDGWVQSTDLTGIVTGPTFDVARFACNSENYHPHSIAEFKCNPNENNGEIQFRGCLPICDCAFGTVDPDDQNCPAPHAQRCIACEQTDSSVELVAQFTPTADLIADNELYALREVSPRMLPTPAGSMVTFGDRFVEFGDWRLGEISSATGSSCLILQHRGEQIATIWTSNGHVCRTGGNAGTVAQCLASAAVQALCGSDLTGSSAVLWSRPVADAAGGAVQGVYFGDRFLQFGRWRFGLSTNGGVVNLSHFGIAYLPENGQITADIRTAEIFRSNNWANFANGGTTPDNLPLHTSFLKRTSWSPWPSRDFLQSFAAAKISFGPKFIQIGTGASKWRLIDVGKDSNGIGYALMSADRTQAPTTTVQVWSSQGAAGKNRWTVEQLAGDNIPNYNSGAVAWVVAAPLPAATGDLMDEVYTWPTIAPFYGDGARYDNHWCWAKCSFVDCHFKELSTNAWFQPRLDFAPSHFDITTVDTYSEIRWCTQKRDTREQCSKSGNCCQKVCREPLDKTGYKIDWEAALTMRGLYPPATGSGVHAVEFEHASFKCADGYHSTLTPSYSEQQIDNLSQQARLKCSQEDEEVEKLYCRPTCFCTNDKSDATLFTLENIGRPNHDPSVCPGPNMQYCFDCLPDYRLRPEVGVDTNLEKRCWSSCSAVTCTSLHPTPATGTVGQYGYNPGGAWYYTKQPLVTYCDEQWHNFIDCKKSCCIESCRPPANIDESYGYKLINSKTWQDILVSENSQPPQLSLYPDSTMAFKQHPDLKCADSHPGTAQLRCLAPGALVELTGCHEKCSSDNAKQLCEHGQAAGNYEVSDNALASDAVCAGEKCSTVFDTTNSDFQTCCAQMCSALNCNPLTTSFLRKVDSSLIQCAGYECDYVTDHIACCADTCDKPTDAISLNTYFVPDWNKALTWYDYSTSTGLYPAGNAAAWTVSAVDPATNQKYYSCNSHDYHGTARFKCKAGGQVIQHEGCSPVCACTHGSKTNTDCPAPHAQRCDSCYEPNQYGVRYQPASAQPPSSYQWSLTGAQKYEQILCWSKCSYISCHYQDFSNPGSATTNPWYQRRVNLTSPTTGLPMPFDKAELLNYPTVEFCNNVRETEDVCREEMNCCKLGCAEPKSAERVWYGIDWETALTKRELYPVPGGANADWHTESGFVCADHYHSQSPEIDPVHDPTTADYATRHFKTPAQVLNAVKLKCEGSGQEVTKTTCIPTCFCTFDRDTSPNADQNQIMGLSEHTPILTPAGSTLQLGEYCPGPTKQFCHDCSDMNVVGMPVKYKLRADNDPQNLYPNHEWGGAYAAVGERRCWASCSGFSCPAQDRTQDTTNGATTIKGGAWYFTKKNPTITYCTEQRWDRQNCEDSCCIPGCRPPDTPAQIYGYSLAPGVADWQQILLSEGGQFPTVSSYPDDTATNWKAHPQLTCASGFFDRSTISNPGSEGPKFLCNVTSEVVRLDPTGCREYCSSDNAKTMCETALINGIPGYFVRTKALNDNLYCEENRCQTIANMNNFQQDFKTCCAQKCTHLDCNPAATNYTQIIDHANTQCRDHACDYSQDRDTCCVHVCVPPVDHKAFQTYTVPDWNAALTWYDYTSNTGLYPRSDNDWVRADMSPDVNLFQCNAADYHGTAEFKCTTSAAEVQHRGCAPICDCVHGTATNTGCPAPHAERCQSCSDNTDPNDKQYDVRVSDKNEYGTTSNPAMSEADLGFQWGDGTTYGDGLYYEQHICWATCSYINCHWSQQVDTQVSGVKKPAWHQRKLQTPPNSNTNQVWCNERRNTVWTCKQHNNCCVMGCREPVDQTGYDIDPWDQALTHPELHPPLSTIPSGTAPGAEFQHASFQCAVNYHSNLTPGYSGSAHKFAVASLQFQATLRCDGPGEEVKLNHCLPTCWCTTDQMEPGTGAVKDNEVVVGTPDHTPGQCPGPTRQHCDSCSDPQKYKLRHDTDYGPNPSSNTIASTIAPFHAKETRCWPACTSITCATRPQTPEQAWYHTLKPAVTYCTRHLYDDQNCEDSCCVAACHKPGYTGDWRDNDGVGYEVDATSVSGTYTPGDPATFHWHPLLSEINTDDAYPGMSTWAMHQNLKCAVGYHEVVQGEKPELRCPGSNQQVLLRGCEPTCYCTLTKDPSHNTANNNNEILGEVDQDRCNLMGIPFRQSCKICTNGNYKLKDEEGNKERFCWAHCDADDFVAEKPSGTPAGFNTFAKCHYREPKDDPLGVWFQDLITPSPTQNLCGFDVQPISTNADNMNAAVENDQEFSIESCQNTCCIKGCRRPPDLGHAAAPRSAVVLSYPYFMHVTGTGMSSSEPAFDWEAALTSLELYPIDINDGSGKGGPSNPIDVSTLASPWGRCADGFYGSPVFTCPAHGQTIVNSGCVDNCFEHLDTHKDSCSSKGYGEPLYASERNPSWKTYPHYDSAPEPHEPLPAENCCYQGDFSYTTRDKCGGVFLYDGKKETTIYGDINYSGDLFQEASGSIQDMGLGTDFQFVGTDVPVDATTAHRYPFADTDPLGDGSGTTRADEYCADRGFGRPLSNSTSVPASSGFPPYFPFEEGTKECCDYPTCDIGFFGEDVIDDLKSFQCQPRDIEIDQYVANRSVVTAYSQSLPENSGKTVIPVHRSATTAYGAVGDANDNTKVTLHLFSDFEQTRDEILNKTHLQLLNLQKIPSGFIGHGQTEIEVPDPHPGHETLIHQFENPEGYKFGDNLCFSRNCDNVLNEKQCCERRGVCPDWESYTPDPYGILHSAYFDEYYQVGKTANDFGCERTAINPGAGAISHAYQLSISSESILDYCVDRKCSYLDLKTCCIEYKHLPIYEERILPYSHSAFVIRGAASPGVDLDTGNALTNTCNADFTPTAIDKQTGRFAVRCCGEEDSVTDSFRTAFSKTFTTETETGELDDNGDPVVSTTSVNVDCVTPANSCTKADAAVSFEEAVEICHNLGNRRLCNLEEITAVRDEATGDTLCKSAGGGCDNGCVWTGSNALGDPEESGYTTDTTTTTVVAHFFYYCDDRSTPDYYYSPDSAWQACNALKEKCHGFQYDPLFTEYKNPEYFEGGPLYTLLVDFDPPPTTTTTTTTVVEEESSLAASSLASSSSTSGAAAAASFLDADLEGGEEKKEKERRDRGSSTADQASSDDGGDSDESNEEPKVLNQIVSCARIPYRRDEAIAVPIVMEYDDYQERIAGKIAALMVTPEEEGNSGEEEGNAAAASFLETELSSSSRSSASSTSSKTALSRARLAQRQKLQRVAQRWTQLTDSDIFPHTTTHYLERIAETNDTISTMTTETFDASLVAEGAMVWTWLKENRYVEVVDAEVLHAIIPGEKVVEQKALPPGASELAVRIMLQENDLLEFQANGTAFDAMEIALNDYLANSSGVLQNEGSSSLISSSSSNRSSSFVEIGADGGADEEEEDIAHLDATIEAAIGRGDDTEPAAVSAGIAQNKRAGDTIDHHEQQQNHLLRRDDDQRSNKNKDIKDPAQRSLLQEELLLQDGRIITGNKSSSSSLLELLKRKKRRKKLQQTSIAVVSGGFVPAKPPLDPAQLEKKSSSNNPEDNIPEVEENLDDLPRGGFALTIWFQSTNEDAKIAMSRSLKNSTIKTTVDEKTEVVSQKIVPTANSTAEKIDALVQKYLAKHLLAEQKNKTDGTALSSMTEESMMLTLEIPRTDVDEQLGVELNGTNETEDSTGSSSAFSSFLATSSSRPHASSSLEEVLEDVDASTSSTEARGAARRISTSTLKDLEPPIGIGTNTVIIPQSQTKKARLARRKIQIEMHRNQERKMMNSQKNLHKTPFSLAQLTEKEGLRGIYNYFNNATWCAAWDSFDPGFGYDWRLGIRSFLCVQFLVFFASVLYVLRFKWNLSKEMRPHPKRLEHDREVSAKKKIEEKKKKKLAKKARKKPKKEMRGEDDEDDSSDSSSSEKKKKKDDKKKPGTAAAAKAGGKKDDKKKPGTAAPGTKGKKGEKKKKKDKKADKNASQQVGGVSVAGEPGEAGGSSSPRSGAQQGTNATIGPPPGAPPSPRGGGSAFGGGSAAMGGGSQMGGGSSAFGSKVGGSSAFGSKVGGSSAFGSKVGGSSAFGGGGSSAFGGGSKMGGGSSAFGGGSSAFGGGGSKMGGGSSAFGGGSSAFSKGGSNKPSPFGGKSAFSPRGGNAGPPAPPKPGGSAAPSPAGSPRGAGNPPKAEPPKPPSDDEDMLGGVDD